MKSVLFAFVLLVFSASLAAQKVDTLSSDYQKLYKSFQILADKGYSIEQITTDSTLSFQALSAIKPSEMGIFWVKLMIYNPMPYAERRFAQFFPVLDNTLYYHDEQQNKWQAARNGLEVPNNQHDFFIYPCVLQAQKNNVIYIKADVSHLQAAADSSVRPAFRLDNEVQVIQRKRDVDMATAVTVMLVFAFFLFNAYIYFIFRDKTYFYYLLTQIGGIVYTLGANKYFSQLMTPRYVQAVLVDRRILGTYDFNDILTRLATTLILFTFVQLTRAYLNTKEHLPKWDKILRVMNVGFLVAMCAVMTWALFFFNFSTVIVDNLWAISTVLTILYVTFLRYRQKDKAARYYLIANSIALGIILFLGIFLLVNPVIYNNTVFQLANIAVVAQAFCLALALVQRLLLIRDELKQKQLETKALQLKNDLITSENLLQKTQNDLLEEKLSSSARELASTTLYMSQKNEMLADLRIHVQSLNKNLTDEGKTTIRKIEMVIQSNSYLDADWERFRIHFERVHPLFFENLQAEHPTLTKNEIRLCAYFHLNLSTKEIAALLNIDPASVRKAKMRLNKKMNGKEEEMSEESA